MSDIPHASAPAATISRTKSCLHLVLQLDHTPLTVGVEPLEELSVFPIFSNIPRPRDAMPFIDVAELDALLETLPDPNTLCFPIPGYINSHVAADHLNQQVLLELGPLSYELETVKNVPSHEAAFGFYSTHLNIICSIHALASSSLSFHQ